MSYILDALRKSDQQRQRGTAPMSLTAQATEVAAKQPSRRWNGLLAAVLVGAGILIGWLRPWQPEQAVPALQPVAVQPLAASPRVAAPAPVAAMAEQAEKPEPEAPPQRSTSAAQSAQPFRGSTAKQDTPEETPARARTETQPMPSQAVGGVPEEAATPKPDKSVDKPTDKPTVTGLADAEPAHRVVALNELPASIQRQIPSLSISLHAYSGNPRERLVMINDKPLRQGDLLAPGLRLEQITPDGVIMGYQGYRFHRGVR